ncbi:hypothetical protein SSPS47_07265 [Streptomyces sp. S4.7]|uniref:recombinase family protein n=1 Tax=Streptomyces sp. S4.7 TaxID=2705439 RepID=UPI00139724D6|nr:recombinase family protein [Streptomyces sp. S4.7]QHY94918.1 hypothetical protein SSPS47_07265 [Streptomyces sp. S4.7]
MVAGPLAGMYDLSGHGGLLFAFFATVAENERENIGESTLEGLAPAARKSKPGGGLRSSPTTFCTPCCGAAPLASPSSTSSPTSSSRSGRAHS